MASSIFVAVGGSGQHTLLAYLRLARLCNFFHPRDCPQPRLMALDSDLRQGSGNGSTTASLVERQARTGFLEPMAWEPVRPLPELRDPMAQIFESLIQPAPGTEADLFQAFFTDRQREVKVVTGFHGHPSVAASTFRLLLTDGAVELQKLLEWIEPKGETQIVVAGSTFGGTGSGVMPVLTSYLRRWARENSRKIRVSGVIQVRWFDLGLPEVSTDRQIKADVTSHDLERNSSCLVEHYRSKLETMFDVAYLIGHDPHAQRRSAGVDQQPEHQHAVNLLSGYVAYQLLHGKDQNAKKGLFGVVTPDGALQDHLQFPFGKDRKLRPLTWHLEATNAEIALGLGVLNILKAGPPHPLEVVEPYPPFFRELVELSQGDFTLSETGRTEPAASWKELLDLQIEALQWLAKVRDESFDIEACQFSPELVPQDRERGRIEAHEGYLKAPLSAAFRQVVGRVRPSRLADEADRVVRRSFLEVRRQLEAFIEHRRKATP